MPVRCVGILTGGGDCPGLNAAIRAVVRPLLSRGVRVFGEENGFWGLVAGRVRPRGDKEVSGIQDRGGTIIGTTNRVDPFQSGLVREVPSERRKTLVEPFRTQGEASANETFASAFGCVASMDFTDGVRMTFASGDIVHLRPSGNAPEFRCYTESSSEEQAASNNHTALEIVARMKNRNEFLDSR